MTMDLDPEKSPIEDLWPRVKKYYESAYKIRFRGMPPEAKVRFLYGEMLKLGESMREALEKGRPILMKLVQSTPADDPAKTQPSQNAKPWLLPDT